MDKRDMLLYQDKFANPEGDQYEFNFGKSIEMKVVSVKNGSQLIFKQLANEVAVSQDTWSTISRCIHAGRHAFFPMKICNIIDSSFILLSRSVVGDLWMCSKEIDHYLKDPIIYWRGNGEWNFWQETDEESTGELEHRILPRFSDERIVL